MHVKLTKEEADEYAELLEANGHGATVDAHLDILSQLKTYKERIVSNESLIGQYLIMLKALKAKSEHEPLTQSQVDSFTYILSETRFTPGSIEMDERIKRLAAGKKAYCLMLKGDPPVDSESYELTSEYLDMIESLDKPHGAL